MPDSACPAETLGLRIVRSGELDPFPFASHQELNTRKDQPVEAVIVRSGQEPVAVNLDIPSPETRRMRWDRIPCTRKHHE
jgi:hypothetical protein